MYIATFILGVMSMHVNDAYIESSLGFRTERWKQSHDCEAVKSAHIDSYPLIGKQLNEDSHKTSDE